MDLEALLQHRRAVKIFDQEKPLDTEKVKHCLELATLAPSSSNMQLWAFYHITDKSVIAELKKACMDQSNVSTASEVVVFVTRQDLYRKRARAVLEFERDNIRRNSPVEKQEKRIKDRELYYGKLMPFLYSRFLGAVGAVRKLVVWTAGVFRPVVYEVSEADMRVVVHKTCALAAQTFMIAMAGEGYDTCPVEGFDSKMIKKILSLPRGAAVNMVVPCGIRKGPESVWGDRFRVPFDEVYHRV
ncbi:Nitroreductase [Arachidicoccus rhizosphaerae]|uniref:Nitroreductase n=1 Tax=Arachidicoccus rhizosphaerae TaxID=551991 RepID=A0A1H4D0L9_9BACT|nr:nitroreductase family protein [Arachidicoccus rhizosphaerae]SEA66177.1 Nitroreductase [Arachidicoccus rhizosphaerae]